jgi:hypothetical protein
MSPPSRPGSRAKPKYINVTVEITNNGCVLLRSGGTTYEVVNDVVYVLPSWVKEAYGQWDGATKKYVTVIHGEVLLLDDTARPSELPMTIKYKGEAVKRFILLLQKVLMMYHRGGKVLRLPLADRNVFKLAIALARMAELQDISNVV